MTTNTTTEKKRFPVMAGMPFGSDVFKIKKVGYKVIEFTYLVYPDGDKVLVNQREVKRVIY